MDTRPFQDRASFQECAGQWALMPAYGDPILVRIQDFAQQDYSGRRKFEVALCDDDLRPNGFRRDEWEDHLIPIDPSAQGWRGRWVAEQLERHLPLCDLASPHGRQRL
jgi:hypothetical protein